MPITTGSSARRALVTATTTLTARQLARDLSSDPAMQVFSASTSAELFDHINLNRPSVILLDTKLAGDSTPNLVHGLTHQKQIPVVLRADAGARPMLLDAIDRGAVAVTTRPTSIAEAAEMNPSLLWTLRAAAGVSISNLLREQEFKPVPSAAGSLSILALGAGIGGLNTLANVLAQLPADGPATLAVTSLPACLTAAWAERLAPRCRMRVRHAVNGDTFQPGELLVAPGGLQTMVCRAGTGLKLAIKDGPAVFHQKPSLEVLFSSLADTAARNTVAAVLSGAGVDGVTSMLSLRRAGARTLAESPQSSACGELPNRAVQCGAAEFTAPANQIAEKMLSLASAGSLSRAA